MNSFPTKFICFGEWRMEKPKERERVTERERQRRTDIQREKKRESK
jgi:hypothetical protein